MNMFHPRPGNRLEWHILRYHGPGNLNRDDTGRPKETYIGGYRRLRLSSQCLKYWIRHSDIFDSFEEYSQQLYGATTFARTRHIGDKIRQIVNDRISFHGAEPIDYKKQLDKILSELPSLFSKKNDVKIKQLIAVSMAEIEILADSILTYNEESNSLELNSIDGLAKELKTISGTGATSPVLALMGRFLTSSKFLRSIDCPLQVAHAVTTHATAIERDYWTAVDDFNSDFELTGSAHMNTRHYGSGVFYEYYCLDVPLLAKNIQESFVDLPTESQTALTQDLIAAFSFGALTSTPQGNKTGFANHDQPDAVYLTYGSAFPHSAINAFEKPVQAAHDGGHMENSIERLEAWIDKRRRWLGTHIGPEASKGLNIGIDMSLDNLVDWSRNETAAAIKLALEQKI